MSSLLPRIDFYSARNGRRLAVRVWSGNKSPQARVVMLHGITSHGGWYNRSCHAFNNQGFEVHFLDRRGSGLNAEGRGDIDRWETWIGDVEVYLEQIRDGRPAVLCGISWGSKLAAAVARMHPGLIRGVALITPGLYSPFEPNALRRLGLRLPVPERRKRRYLEIPLTRGSLYTETPYWRDFVDRDPLSLRQVTHRFAQADNRLTRYARAAATFIHTPTLMMLSGRDRIVTNSQCHKFFERVAANRKSLVEYSNAVHTLEFEPDPERYQADLADWIERTIAS